MITVKQLQDDLLEQVSSMPGSDALIHSINNDGRFYRHAYEAVKQFILSAPLSAIDNYIKVVDLSVRTNIGVNGLIEGLKAYKFPDEAFEPRTNHGMVSFVTGGREISPEFAPSYDMAAHILDSIYYNETGLAVVDESTMTVYADPTVTLKAKVVTLPDRFQPNLPATGFFRLEPSNDVNTLFPGDVVEFKIPSESGTADIEFSVTSTDGTIGDLIDLFLQELIEEVSPDDPYAEGFLHAAKLHDGSADPDPSVLIRATDKLDEYSTVDVEVVSGRVTVTKTRGTVGSEKSDEFDVDRDFQTQIVDLIKNRILRSDPEE